MSNDAPPTKISKEDPTSPLHPPSYVGYQTYSGLQPYPQAHVGYAVGEVPRRTAGQRFIRVFLAGTSIWLLFSLLVKGPFAGVHWGPRDGPLMQMLDDWEYTVPADVTLEQCVQGGEWEPSSLNAPSAMVESSNSSAAHMSTARFHSETSFDLPLSSDTLFFLSRGQDLGGIAKVTTSSKQAQDFVAVNVVIHYNREELLDLSKACLLSRGDGENGVGLFTPVWRFNRRPRGRDYGVVFEITIILPELSRDSAPLTINNFETDFSNSVHQVDDLNGKVAFQSILLKGSNAPIVVKSLTATNGKIHTSNGPISGTFNTTKVLILETSNSPILVDVGLESDKGGSSPVFNAHTTNGKLAANVSLISASDSGGSFDIVTTTSNSPLHVVFPASPIDSKLSFKAKTSNSPALVSLNAAYEGSFTLQTSIFVPSVRRKPDVEDPTGKERTRRVDSRNVGKRITVGDVYWESIENSAGGVVAVETSNSPLVLEI